jgi:hypothetical protein
MRGKTVDLSPFQAQIELMVSARETTEAIIQWVRSQGTEISKRAIERVLQQWGVVRQAAPPTPHLINRIRQI